MDPSKCQYEDKYEDRIPYLVVLDNIHLWIKF